MWLVLRFLLDIEAKMLSVLQELTFQHKVWVGDRKCESLAYGQSSVLCVSTVIVVLGNSCGLRIPIPLKVCFMS